MYSVIDKAVSAMKAKGIRVKVDNRDHLRPGWLLYTTTIPYLLITSELFQ